MIAHPTSCQVFELRQYTLHPGQRDTLVDLFEREFIESQEAAGMQLVGTFRDLDAPDRFVWLRGFADMPARAQALAAFYGGPVWQAHRDAANATMIDSDNVLLLRPALADSGFAPDPVPCPRSEADTACDGVVIATLLYFDAAVDEDFATALDASIAPVIRASGGALLAMLITEPAANNFPRLPVREGEHVFAWFAAFADVDAFARAAEAFATLPPSLQQRVARSDTLRLSPTPRSRLPRRA